jgi:ATP-dependent protease ClpP protease subunit
MDRKLLALPKINDNRPKPENIEIEKVGTIHNAATNTLHINDMIDNWMGISAEDVKNALSEMDETQPLRVVINSDGGSVYEAIAIHNQIAEWPGEVTTHISSLAASSASFIAMVGDKRTIADNAKFMIHHPWTFAAGNAAEFRALAGMLDKTGEGLIDMYDRKSSLSREEISSLMTGEDGADGTYLSATEALDAGFVTGIVDTSRSKPANSVLNALKPRLISARIKISDIDFNSN